MIAVAAVASLNYSGAEQIPGTIRIWGTPQMQTVVDRWANNFDAIHPSVRVLPKLLGTETGMAGLYTGIADVAVMGRRATPKEIMGFEWVFKYKPVEIAILTGSLDVPGKAPALAVFVHQDNPVSQLTLAQVDAIFSCERLRGLTAIESWAQVGLRGAWAHEKVHAYGFDTETGSASFFKTVVMNGSGKWNWPHLHEFKDAQQILDTLARDPAGIAVSNLCYTNPHVKPVALSREQGAQFYLPTRESLITQSYPLTRLAYAYVNRPPGKPMSTLILEFLKYVLSEAGQQEAIEGGYLPLNAISVEEQRGKLR